MKNIDKDGVEYSPEIPICIVCKTVIDTEMPFEIDDEIICDDCKDIESDGMDGYHFRRYKVEQSMS